MGYPEFSPVATKADLLALQADLLNRIASIVAGVSIGVYNVIPTMDVTNTIATLPFNYISGSVRLTRGGTRDTDFTETVQPTITLGTPLQINETILIDFDRL